MRKVRCNNEINTNNKKFMMSNSNTDFVKQNFPEEKYSIKVITAKRSINSKNPSSKTRELIIKNY